MKKENKEDPNLAQIIGGFGLVSTIVAGIFYGILNANTGKFYDELHTVVPALIIFGIMLIFGSSKR